MVELDDVRQGWEFMAEVLGADQAAFFIKEKIEAQNSVNQFNINATQENLKIDEYNEHIGLINRAIDKLEHDINTHPKRGNLYTFAKGDMAEPFVADTFNIDAIRHNSMNRAWTVDSTAYGSVDVDTNFGKSYQLKIYNTPKEAERVLSELDPDGITPKYQGQERLIAEGQLDEAKQWADYRKNKSQHRPYVRDSHIETKAHLTTKIIDDEGNESRSLTVQEAEKIAKEAKNGKFKAEDYGIEKEKLKEHIDLKDEIQIDYVNQALKAGLTAAAITAITQIVPELYKSIDYLIKNGEIDLKQVAKSGAKIISSSGEAFLRGSIAYGLEVAIQHGFFGEAMKAVPPTVVGTMVTIVLGTVKNSILVAAGKMTKEEMGMKFVDTVVMSTGYLVGMKIGGIIAQAINPHLPGIAYAIGSLIGCSIAVVYNIGKKKLISFCIDTGFTCFGLVEQNYELPEQVLKQLGIDTVKIEKTEFNQIQVETTNVFDSVNESQYETIDMTMLKRGIIGVNKIGYVLK